ncbi:hypothetical protein [Paraburkholderia caribensis]|uniref:hypothetical protein n=1 Tax=Paraburkholderia caribensis TaxID=75105 RepID=UPI00078C100C|nr:hypothetical protein [Paraburkholderia caribensis]AMV48210.1 hypothetical protein ATN79_46950 [Paraburkholderia caribensis]
MKNNRLTATFVRLKSPIIISTGGMAALCMAWMQTHFTNPANLLNRLFAIAFQPDVVLALPFVAFALLIAGTYRKPREREVSNDPT